LIKIFVIVKTLSGKELVFFNKSEPTFINIGLKYKEVVIMAILDCAKRAIPAKTP
jgi:hypothetical protein